MRKWIYVICEQSEDGPEFRHAFVLAEDEETAYTIAGRQVRQSDGNGINDYVAEIGEFPAGAEVHAASPQEIG